MASLTTVVQMLYARLRLKYHIQTDKQTDRQTNRQTDRQTDRQEITVCPQIDLGGIINSAVAQKK